MGTSVLPWMGGSREERVERLRAWYESRGVVGALKKAERMADDPLSNLCGEMGPVLAALDVERGLEGLAADWGVTRARLYQVILEFAPEDWTRFSAAHSLVKMEDAERALEAATDSVEVSKRMALLKANQWNLERMARKLYGQREEGGGGVQVVVNLDRSCGGVVVEVDEGGVVSRRRVVHGAEAVGEDADD